MELGSFRAAWAGMFGEGEGAIHKGGNAVSAKWMRGVAERTGEDGGVDEAEAEEVGADCTAGNDGVYKCVAAAVKSTADAQEAITLAKSPQLVSP